MILNWCHMILAVITAARVGRRARGLARGGLRERGRRLGNRLWLGLRLDPRDLGHRRAAIGNDDAGSALILL
jgi:hypothetical protein